jgi:hypothetical protein
MIRRWRLDVVFLAVLAVVLIAPLFRVEYLLNWPSIESTFIADARMLRDHLPHPGWQPLWYVGTRFDYVYPPALRYAAALISLFAGISTARAYHIYVGIFYVIGILAVWWFVWVGTRSRVQAGLAALMTLLVSPTELLLPAVRVDNVDWWPNRLYVLMQYGEGPHMTSLALLPFALGASLLAFREKSARWLVGAALLSALVVSHNFYGATALAFFFPILVWAVFVTKRDFSILKRAAAIATLAWGMCAFWLTPSYLRITMANLHTVSDPSDARSVAAMAGAIIVFAVVTWRMARDRPERMWGVFVAGGALLLGFDVLGFYFAHLRVLGETARLVPELDILIILTAVTAAAGMWRIRLLRIPALFLIGGLLAPAWIYLQLPYKYFAGSGPLRDQYVRQVANWAENNLPGERVLPAGMVRFWWDAWADNPQADGGSKQGRLNRELPDAVWQVIEEKSPVLAPLWLQAMGASAVVVSEPGSREYYRDYKSPQKFRETLPKLWDDGAHTTVYGVPRVYRSIARIVDKAEMEAMPAITGGADEAGLRRYLAQVERADRPQVSVEWKGFDEVGITATTSPGQEVLFQETFDPAWHAYENGRAVPIQRDPAMDFMLLRTGEGRHQIEMRFETPLENRVGQGMFVVAVGLCVWLVSRKAGRAQ